MNSVNQLIQINLLFNQSINQSINRSKNKSINETINQPTNQPILLDWIELNSIQFNKLGSAQ